MTVEFEICKTFNKQAADYERAAKVQQEIGARLVERLQYLRISPQRILDLGCGPGMFSRQLAQMYPKATIIGLDIAHGMLVQSKKRQSWRRRWPLVNADMHHLPFENGFFDLVFANQVVHWGHSIHQVFREINRVLNGNGCFMFTTLGPDTFKEIKDAWQGIGQHAHVNEFMDMHDVGDSIMAEKFLEPVMDMEYLSVHYASFVSLIHSLKQQGVRNVNSQRNPGLTGKDAWRKFQENYDSYKTEDGKFPLTYEIVYGHAWKGMQTRSERGVETVIPIGSIVRAKK